MGHIKIGNGNGTERYVKHIEAHIRDAVSDNEPCIRMNLCMCEGVYRLWLF